jgi:uncharacterized protein (TIGR03067 family)
MPPRKEEPISGSTLWRRTSYQSVSASTSNSVRRSFAAEGKPGIRTLFVLEKQKEPAAEAGAGEDLEKMQGSWRVVSFQVGDEKASADEVKKRKVVVKGDRLTYEFGNEQKEKREGTIKLDPKTKAFDWIIVKAGATMKGIYDLKGDDLKIGFGNDGLIRPTRFEFGKDQVQWLLVLKRSSPNAGAR